MRLLATCNVQFNITTSVFLKHTDISTMANNQQALESKYKDYERSLFEDSESKQDASHHDEVSNFILWKLQLSEVEYKKYFEQQLRDEDHTFWIAYENALVTQPARQVKLQTFIRWKRSLSRAEYYAYFHGEREHCCSMS